MQSAQGLLEIKDLPECHPQVQQAQTSYRTSNPSGSHHALQTIESGFTSRVQQKVVVAPVTQAEKPLRNPRQQGEHYANFQAQNDVENDAEFGRHES